jgi:hypothetical protein
VPHPAHFDDRGLHLPPQSSGDNQDGDGSGALFTTAQLPQTLPAHCAIEVEVRFSGPDAAPWPLCVAPHTGILHQAGPGALLIMRLLPLIQRTCKTSVRANACSRMMIGNMERW